MGNHLADARSTMLSGLESGNMESGAANSDLKANINGQTYEAGGNGSWDNQETESDNGQGQNDVQDVNLKGKTPQEIEDILDLSKAKKVRLGDEELTIEDLKKQRLMQSDYTKKTQALAKERAQLERFNNSLDADLETLEEVLSQDPQNAEQLLAKFKEIYPAQFHKFADKVFQLGQRYSKGEQTQDSEADPIDKLYREMEKRLENRFKKYDSYLDKQARREQEIAVEQSQKDIDLAFEQNKSKYPDAVRDQYDEATILSFAEQLSDRKYNEDPRSGGKLTSEDWNELFKQMHDRNTKYSKESQKKLFTNQKNANLRSQDTGRGGSTPGPIPKVPGNLREAREALMRDAESGNFKL